MSRFTLMMTYCHLYGSSMVPGGGLCLTSAGIQEWMPAKPAQGTDCILQDTLR
jgi:hypothetical protein